MAIDTPASLLYYQPSVNSSHNSTQSFGYQTTGHSAPIGTPVIQPFSESIQMQEVDTPLLAHTESWTSFLHHSQNVHAEPVRHAEIQEQRYIDPVQSQTSEVSRWPLDMTTSTLGRIPLRRQRDSDVGVEQAGFSKSTDNTLAGIYQKAFGNRIERGLSHGAAPNRFEIPCFESQMNPIQSIGASVIAVPQPQSGDKVDMVSGNRQENEPIADAMKLFRSAKGLISSSDVAFVPLLESSIRVTALARHPERLPNNIDTALLPVDVKGPISSTEALSTVATRADSSAEEEEAIIKTTEPGVKGDETLPVVDEQGSTSLTEASATLESQPETSSREAKKLPNTKEPEVTTEATLPVVDGKEAVSSTEALPTVATQSGSSDGEEEAIVKTNQSEVTGDGAAKGSASSTEASPGSMLQPEFSVEEEEAIVKTKQPEVTRDGTPIVDAQGSTSSTEASSISMLPPNPSVGEEETKAKTKQPEVTTDATLSFREVKSRMSSQEATVKKGETTTSSRQTESGPIADAAMPLLDAAGSVSSEDALNTNAARSEPKLGKDETKTSVEQTEKALRADETAPLSVKAKRRFHFSASSFLKGESSPTAPKTRKIAGKIREDRRSRPGRSMTVMRAEDEQTVSELEDAFEKLVLGCKRKVQDRTTTDVDCNGLKKRARLELILEVEGISQSPSQDAEPASEPAANASEPVIGESSNTGVQSSGQQAVNSPSISIMDTPPPSINNADTQSPTIDISNLNPSANDSDVSTINGIDTRTPTVHQTGSSTLSANDINRPSPPTNDTPTPAADHTSPAGVVADPPRSGKRKSKYISVDEEDVWGEEKRSSYLSGVSSFMQGTPFLFSVDSIPSEHIADAIVQLYHEQVGQLSGPFEDAVPSTSGVSGSNAEIDVAPSTASSASSEETLPSASNTSNPSAPLTTEANTPVVPITRKRVRDLMDEEEEQEVEERSEEKRTRTREENVQDRRPATFLHPELASISHLTAPNASPMTFMSTIFSPNPSAAPSAHF
ncbi:hypothetical protein HDU67_000944 [Dinochytrium kinnereticum]|nr:hypothetical protein HDU67_000944 [Dinochytrium kinnereticum]